MEEKITKWKARNLNTYTLLYRFMAELSEHDYLARQWNDNGTLTESDMDRCAALSESVEIMLKEIYHRIDIWHATDQRLRDCQTHLEILKNYLYLGMDSEEDYIGLLSRLGWSEEELKKEKAKRAEEEI